MKDKYQFIVDFAVRDYECDMYGVVNNAVYQNYLEHARNENLKAVGLNFTAMAQEGQRIFVSKITLHYTWVWDL